MCRLIPVHKIFKAIFFTIALFLYGFSGLIPEATAASKGEYRKGPLYDNDFSVTFQTIRKEFNNRGTLEVEFALEVTNTLGRPARNVSVGISSPLLDEKSPQIPIVKKLRSGQTTFIRVLFDDLKVPHIADDALFEDILLWRITYLVEGKPAKNAYVKGIAKPSTYIPEFSLRVQRKDKARRSNGNTSMSFDIVLTNNSSEPVEGVVLSLSSPLLNRPINDNIAMGEIGPNSEAKNTAAVTFKSLRVTDAILVRSFLWTATYLDASGLPRKCYLKGLQETTGSGF